jgi:TolA-binding protein
LQKEDFVKWPVAIAMMAVIILACGGSVPDEKTLLDQAQKFQTSENYPQACDLYEKLIKHYPNSDYRYKAIFMVGYMQLENLKNPKKAKKMFEKLLNEYPNCDLADDSEVLLKIAESGKDITSALQDSIDKH